MIDYMIYGTYFAVGFFFWWGLTHQILSFMVSCEYETPRLGIMILVISVIFGAGYSAVLLGNPLFFVAACIGGFFASLFEGAYSDWKKWKMKKEQDGESVSHNQT